MRGTEGDTGVTTAEMIGIAAVAGMAVLALGMVFGLVWREYRKNRRG